jgi:hypothetical protein
MIGWIAAFVLLVALAALLYATIEGVSYERYNRRILEGEQP